MMAKLTMVWLIHCNHVHGRRCTLLMARPSASGLNKVVNKANILVQFIAYPYSCIYIAFIFFPVIQHCWNK